VNPRSRIPRLAGLGATVLAICLVGAPTVAAHTEQHIGDFQALIGWLNEPALAGQPNAVQLTITDHDEAPVTDIGPDDLKVVVSTGGVDSAPLALTPAFDVEEGFGTPGEYHAELIPTAPGDYTFHFSGTLHDTAVDLTVTSGPETFAAIEASSDLEFPVKQPTPTEVGTRPDRIDGRIEALQSTVPGGAAIAAANAAAASAQAAADRALLIGALVGGAGLLVGIAALVMAMRGSRRAAGSA
jgi:hypothetical protein